MNANLFNNEFNAAIGFESVFGGAWFCDNMDEVADLFCMGNEI